MQKKILIVIVFRDFRDEEYFVPKEILEKAGINVTTASTQKGIASGVMGGEAQVDLMLSEIDINKFDGIVFVGGQGVHKHIDDKQFHHLAQEAIKSQKVLAAICIAPAILAKAGVLKGKKATVWSNALDKSAVKILQENGAVYQSDSVVQDRSFITANGPAAANEFGRKIVEVLTSLEGL